MTQWIIETLVWTGLLIIAVLALRRPMARYFGPQAAYALWLMPLIRLALPPLVLPAWLAPATRSVSASPSAVSDTVTSFTGAVVGQAASGAASSAAAPAASMDWFLALLCLWLTGAAAFLIVRFRGYFVMRRGMLADAHPVGEDGPVRLVETPMATAPIAFGVIDKVIALPPGFMAMYNRQQRDLALAHELAHHRAHDLLANMLVQPLFALHWFNPLAWIGWRALRRDQEAACDARVVARRSAEERATYAEVIARFAAGPKFSAAKPLAWKPLAAPMACPVLGDKSIIHRLRSLTMNDISPRRRIAGRMLIGAALLSLPLTASISYAEGIAPPAPPAVPLAAAAPLVPSVPVAPAAPIAPPAPDAPPAAPAKLMAVYEAPETDSRNVVVERKIITGPDGDTADGGKHRMVFISKDEDHKMTAEERAEMRAEIKRDMAEMKQDLAEARKEMLMFKDKDGKVTKVNVDCEGKGKGKNGSWADKSGKAIELCTTDIMASALDGIKKARAEVANSKDMAGDIRAEVLKALDEAIAGWNKDGG